MARTADKIILGVLFVMLVGMSSVFITAVSSEDSTQQNKAAIRLLPSESSQNIENDDKDDNEKEDVPITGSALERASATALAYIGEGRVTDTEIGDEEGYYEIEITLNNGRQVDVHLDRNFNVLSAEWEDEGDDD